MLSLSDFQILFEDSSSVKYASLLKSQRRQFLLMHKLAKSLEGNKNTDKKLQSAQCMTCVRKCRRRESQKYDVTSFDKM